VAVKLQRQLPKSVRRFLAQKRLTLLGQHTFRSPVPADIPLAAAVPALPRERPAGIGFPSQAAIELPQILRAPVGG